MTSVFLKQDLSYSSEQGISCLALALVSGGKPRHPERNPSDFLKSCL